MGLSANQFARKVVPRFFLTCAAWTRASRNELVRALRAQLRDEQPTAPEHRGYIRSCQCLAKTATEEAGLAVLPNKSAHVPPDTKPCMLYRWVPTGVEQVPIPRIADQLDARWSFVEQRKSSALAIYYHPDYSNVVNRVFEGRSTRCKTALLYGARVFAHFVETDWSAAVTWKRPTEIPTTDRHLPHTIAGIVDRPWGPMAIIVPADSSPDEFSISHETFANPSGLSRDFKDEAGRLSGYELWLWDLPNT